MITIVGGDEAIRMALGLPPTASPEELWDDLDSRDRAGTGRSCWYQYMRFLTPEEYLAEVGAEQVALETQEDPTGPPAVYLK
jgi:hypothetical protein